MRILLAFVLSAIGWALASPARAQADPALPAVEPTVAAAPVSPETDPASTTPTATNPTPSQGDPRWKNIRLGNGTVGSQGCLAMSLFMAVADLGYRYSPLSFLDMLKDYDLFDRAGRLYWNIGQAIPGLRAVRLPFSGNDAIAAARQQLADGSKVLLEVLTSRHTFHWVMVSAINGVNVVIRDPNGGKVGTLDALYAGSSAVKGLAVISRN